MTIMERLIAAEEKADKAQVLALRANGTLLDQAAYIKDLKAEIEQVTRHMQRALKDIKDLTNIDVDAAHHKNGTHRVIVSGHLQGRDYVNIFHLPGDSTESLVWQLRTLERQATLRRVDAPRGNELEHLKYTRGYTFSGHSHVKI